MNFPNSSYTVEAFLSLRPLIHRSNMAQWSEITGWKIKDCELKCYIGKKKNEKNVAWAS